MTTSKAGIGTNRLNASTRGAYEIAPEQRRAAAKLVCRQARNHSDARHILTVLGILADGDTDPAQGGTP